MKMSKFFAIRPSTIQFICLIVLYAGTIIFREFNHALAIRHVIDVIPCQTWNTALKCTYLINSPPSSQTYIINISFSVYEQEKPVYQLHHLHIYANLDRFLHLLQMKIL